MVTTTARKHRKPSNPTAAERHSDHRRSKHPLFGYFLVDREARSFLDHPADSYTTSLLPPTSVSITASILLVAIGGAAGSVARFGLNKAAEASVGTLFPAGTLIANVIGCLAVGVFLFFLTDRGQPTPQTRLMVITGFLGGLTTFSSFGLETIQLMQSGHAARAIANVAANVVGGLFAAWLGFTLAKALA